MDERHSITIDSFGIIANSVVITVASTPTKYTLYLNSPLDIDSDHDGRADIRVTLTALTLTYAEINFVYLRPAGPTPHLLGLLGVGA